MWDRRKPSRAPLIVAVLMFAAGLVGLLRGQSISVPNTFTNGTTADANQVNANFTALANGALNRAAGTMTGTLNSRAVIPTSDATYDLGSSSFRFKDLWISGSICSGGTCSTPLPFSVCDLRLSLTAGTPLTTADVTAATTVYASPMGGGQCFFLDVTGNAWTPLTVSETAVTVPASTNTNYDLFCRNNAGTMACDTTAWASDTARAGALVSQNGVLVKSLGDVARRYIGTFRTTGVSGQTEDSQTKRYVWSYYRRYPRPLMRADSTASWVYGTATIRQVRATATNQVEIVIGVTEDLLRVSYNVVVGSDQASLQAHQFGVGLDSTVAFVGNQDGVYNVLGPTALERRSGRAQATFFPGIGYHTITMLEAGSGAGTTTWYGTATYTGSGVLIGTLPG